MDMNDVRKQVFPAGYEAIGITDPIFLYGVTDAMSVAKAVEWAMQPENHRKVIRFVSICHPAYGQEVYKVFHFAFFPAETSEENSKFFVVELENDDRYRSDKYYASYAATSTASEDMNNVAIHAAQLTERMLHRTKNYKDVIIVRLTNEGIAKN